VVVADAQACAAAASARAGVRVVEMTTMEQITALGELLRDVWQAPDVSRVAEPGLLRALAHGGNYVVGAYRDRALVGATWAFLGRHEPEGGPRYAGTGMTGELHLHSHITGVPGGNRGRGVGYALKQHQRAWALARGIRQVRWTFDPLVRRNAYFNLRRLGAGIVRYLPDFYGPMNDGINAGDASDRLYVHWHLDAPEAVAAAHDPLAPAPARGEELLGVLGDEPTVRPLAELLGAEHLRVATPADIEKLRTGEPALAAAWRETMRTTLGGALAAGYRITGLTDSGAYQLVAGESA
jgi:predicted GNAT superfamily acetyltransferase